MSGLPASLYFHQPGFDRALRSAVGAMPGVEVRLGTEVVGIEDADEECAIFTRAGAQPGELRASWLLGCDGASSLVRESQHLELESFGFDEQWLVLDLILGDDVEGLPDHAVHVCDPVRPHTAIPMSGPRYRFELMLLPGERAAEMQRVEKVQQMLGRWLDPRQVQVERAAVYTFHGLVADRWRNGRVLIAGDAAHQMPPFLGQGMCSGLRDVTHLAWKLHRVIKQGSPEALIDTYQAERRPHVHAITRRWSISATSSAPLIPTTHAAARERSSTIRDRRSNVSHSLRCRASAPRR